MPFIKLKTQLVGLGERAVEICSAINNNFRHFDRKKQNKFFIRSDDPANIEGIELEPRDIWIDTSGDADFYTITIIQSEHQTIYVNTDDSSYTTNVTLPAGTHFTVTVVPDEGFAAGATNITEGTLFHDVTIYAQYAAGVAHTIFIQQTPNQTIYVSANGFDYTEDVVLKEGTDFTVRVEANDGFTAGKPSITGGELMHDITVTATEATYAQFTVHIVQSDHQLISVLYNSVTYTSDFTVTYGDHITASITADEGYIAGTLNITSLSVSGDTQIYATPATLKQFMLNIVQTAHQTITVSCNGRQYTSSVRLPYGTVFTVSIRAEEGYAAGTPNMLTGTITGNMTVTADAAKILYYTIHIQQSEHQTINVVVGDNRYTSDVSLPYGTIYNVSVTPDEGYDAGKLSTLGGELTQDITITVTEAIRNIFWIRIRQYQHQRITVSANGQTYNDDVQLPYGTNWTASIIADTGYTPGKLNMTSGTLTSDVELYATSTSGSGDGEATLNKYWIRIRDYQHQTITVVADGQTYTDDVQLPYGTRWNAYIRADAGYTAGNLNQTGGILTADIELYATSSAGSGDGEATLNHYWIHITDYQHQTITVSANSQKYTEDVQLPYGTEWTASIAADTGYTAGTLNMTYGTLTEDITLFAKSGSGDGEATINMYWIRIRQYQHQTITVVANGHSYTEDVQLPYGTTWTASIAADTGYTAGTLNMDSGTLTADIEIYARSSSGTGDGEATLNQYTITIQQSAHQTITVSANGQQYQSTVTLPYGTHWTASIAATSAGYVPGSLNMRSGTLTANITIYASEAIKSTLNITITQVSNQVIHIYTPNKSGIDRTSSFQCDYGQQYEAQVIPEMWWNAGTLNIPTSGTFTRDTNVTVTATTLRTDYDLSITIANSTERPSGGIGFNVSVPGSPNSYGSVNPEYVCDGFTVWGEPYTNRSYFYFWGRSAVTGLFSTCDITARDTITGEEYVIGKNIPNSAFDSTGDIRGTNTTGVFTQELFNWVKKRLGGGITIHLHINP